MAKKKSRKIESWRIKWTLVYIMLVFFFILCFIATIIFLEDGMFKICAIIYETTVIIVSIGSPIMVYMINAKESKRKKQYNISELELENDLKK
mgnify:CR=1 FL=1